MRSLIRVAVVMSLALVAVFGMANVTTAQNVSENEAYANVVVCTDPDCAGAPDMGGMEGAIITSYDAAGVEIDSCAVETFASGLNGCVITQHDGDGWYSATITDAFAGYTLLDDAPEVLESVSHGTQLVWYAVPAADGAPPAEDPVEEMPEVGVGIGSQSDLLAVAAFGIALLGVSAAAMRKYGSEM